MCENTEHTRCCILSVLISVSEIATHSERCPRLEELIRIEDPLIVGAQQRTSASS